MRIDSTAIREKVRRDYDKAVRSLEKARGELERFQTQDQPAYSRWFNTTFGALLTELREITQKLEAQREIVFQVESEAFMTGCSDYEAYERVMWERAHPEEAAARQKEDSFAEDFEDFLSGFAEQFEEMFGRMRDGDEPWPDEEPCVNPAPPPQAVPPRLKGLYRTLVRLLHPDAQGQMTAQKKEWWHEVQAAYEKGDVERLQVILTLCEIEEKGSTTGTSVSLILRITREMRSSLRRLNAQLRRFRQEPAWNFSALTDYCVLAERVGMSLRRELAEARRQLSAHEKTLKLWAERTRMPRRRSPRRRMRLDSECPF